MTQTRQGGSVSAAILLAAFTVLAACGGGAGSAPTAGPATPAPATAGPATPAPATPVASSPARPSSSPAAGRVNSPQEAAARVAASDQRFVGIGELDPRLIGASAWWTGESIADDGFRISYVIGWGDCQAGCINRHQWVFEVTAAGAVALVDESGDELPAASR